jgi:hypothetical protein
MFISKAEKKMIYVLLSNLQSSLEDAKLDIEILKENLPRKKSTAGWTPAKREAHSVRLKKMWAEKKAQKEQS